MRPSQKFLEEASKKVEPVYAQGFFFVSHNYISYYLIFDYDDPLGYYDTVVKNEELFNEEVAKLWANMQQFLDAETVKINNTRVFPKVIMIDIRFRRGRRNPYIVFLIRFGAPIKKGVNVYENIYESEIAEYDYVAYWVFPPGSKILRVSFGSGEEQWDIVGNNVLAIYGWKNMRTGGYEYIEFEILK
ncbi:hypothetical protein QPL79_06985 [Ignisphaera sp. 4213-co]|uniref:Uncharacterized protein n=1 Tax=Ignisphaera cupida TaxID=3050454 RepID=A0ABD4Z7C1_9CREN|nr:hypothetical protein [Ignisphaera sp. 4213-co]MDK6029105.1 hypothetical protein [Ignisphaera sp. 4213-co]